MADVLDVVGAKHFCEVTARGTGAGLPEEIRDELIHAAAFVSRSPDSGGGISDEERTRA